MTLTHPLKMAAGDVLHLREGDSVTLLGTPEVDPFSTPRPGHQACRVIVRPGGDGRAFWLLLAHGDGKVLVSA